MKKIQLYIFIGFLAVVTTTSCKKFMDINDNPNSPTSGTPELVLRQSIVRTAGLIPGFNNFGSRLIGYQANAGGYGGWGDVVSYNYTTGSWASIFESIYKANEDLQVVIDLSKADDAHNAFIASALILQSYNYQTLVDTYNDVPYTEALTGAKSLQPKYDKAEVIYKALADSIDVALRMLDATPTTTAFKSSDPLFNGDISLWKQFANTVKLRLILRANGKVTFTNTTFNPAGFLTEDAIVNPGYTKVAGKQNPMWNSWAYSASGSSVSVAYIPTPYILAFYDGSKISDGVRAKLVFRGGTGVATNQLGYQGDDAKKGPTPSAWFVGTDATTYSKAGILKGPDMGQPIMLASESYFLLAQANLKGITGTVADAKANFNKGVIASFKYLEKDNTGNVPATYMPTDDFNAYLAANAGNRLVDFDLATSSEQKLEAIVTQEYIAMNMVTGHQAWFEYLRTGYPAVTGANSTANKKNTFVSFASESTAANKLPTRVLYPASEYKYNAKNIPDGISAFTSKIFWAK